MKNGGYVHGMFARNGLPLLCRSDDFPPFIHLDMARADERGDLRLEHIELPAGATLRPHATTEGNCLLARAKRIRGDRRFGN